MATAFFAPAPIQAHRVPERQRMEFLPHLFGARHAIRGESAVYRWMRALAAAYDGGFWAFYRLGNGGGYLAPCRDGTLALFCPGNGFEGDVSADAAGIVATLYALNQLACETGSDLLVDRYDRLRDFALLEHPERAAIARAID